MSPQSVRYGMRVVFRIDDPATDASGPGTSDEPPGPGAVSPGGLRAPESAGTGDSGARRPRVRGRHRRRAEAVEPTYNPLDYDPRVDRKARERRRIRRIALLTVVALAAMGIVVMASRITSPYDHTDLTDLRSATSLTVEQGRDLRAGLPITLNDEQITHLTLALEDLDSLDVTQMATLAYRTSTAPALADALQLVSHPRVDTGGAKLPARVRDLLEGSASVPAQPYPGAGVVDIPRLDEYSALAGILARGTTGLRTGTDVDRGLIASAAGIAAAAGSGAQLGGNAPFHRIDPADITTTIGSMLDVTSDDLQAVHDAVLGTGMPAGYNRDVAITALLTHDWGSHPEPMRNLFGWIGGDHETAIAGETANALAHLIADRYDAFVDIRAGGLPTAAIDPFVARSMAETLRPYLSALAGDGRAAVQNIAMFSGSEEYANFLAVLGSQPDARRVLNNALVDAAEGLARDFGSNPQAPITANGTVIGRLTTAMYRGTQLAAERFDGRTEPVSRDEINAIVESDIGPRSSGRTTDLYLAWGLLQSRPELAREPTLAAHLRPGQTNQLSWEQVDVIGFAVQRWAGAHGIPLDQFTAGITDGRQPGLWSTDGGR